MAGRSADTQPGPDPLARGFTMNHASSSAAGPSQLCLVFCSFHGHVHIWGAFAFHVERVPPPGRFLVWAGVTSLASAFCAGPGAICSPGSAPLSLDHPRCAGMSAGREPWSSASSVPPLSSRRSGFLTSTPGRSTVFTKIFLRESRDPRIYKFSSSWAAAVSSSDRQRRPRRLESPEA